MQEEEREPLRDFVTGTYKAFCHDYFDLQSQPRWMEQSTETTTTTAATATKTAEVTATTAATTTTRYT